MENNKKSTKRIILFRFHDHFDICANRLKIIRHYNPGIGIWGLFGGKKTDIAKAKKLKLNHVWYIPLDDPYWKWLNGDLAIRWWYREYGHKINFGLLHVFEWDMIFLGNIDKEFKHIKNGVGITNRQPLAPIYDSWSWVAPKRGRKEWLGLKKLVQDRYNWQNKPLAGIFGGAILSKKFLDKFADEDIPSLCNDEVRLSLFAQSFKMSVYDTKLKNNYFYTKKKPISSKIVYKMASHGLKSFHPVREKLDLQKLISK